MKTGPTRPAFMDKRVLAGASVAAAVAAALLVFFLAGGTGSDGARSTGPVPPCPDGMGPSADGNACVDDSEACHAWYTQTDRRTVRCAVQSVDGQGVLRFAVQGQGRAEVRVFDASNRIVHSRDASWTSILEDDDAVSGARGTWTLEVTFIDARGSGRITLWG